MNKFLRRGCFRFSTLLLAAGLQCYAYAGFAVNTAQGEPGSIYESPTMAAAKCVSKDQAIEFYQKNINNKYSVVFAYNLNVDGLDSLDLETVSPTNSFCINSYTHKIGVAEIAKDAMALAQGRPQVFFTKAGDTLSGTLDHWAKEQGYILKWLSPNDFTIEVGYTFRGPFAQALDELLQSIAASSDGFAVKATIMKNGVVVIKENEYQAKPVIG